MEEKPKMLEKLKLNKLRQIELELRKNEMNVLVGGSGACTCTCSGSIRPSADYSIGSHSNSVS